ncbi:NUDIX hydrolase [Promicromonospora iranensis]|nr:NUDIX hydrolase [Promicromonospora iranensis]
MSAGVLLYDDAGRVVLVEPSYKPTWDIPGGVVDAGESPWHAAARELSEELGIVRRHMRLLVVDHVPGSGRATGSPAVSPSPSPPRGTTPDRSCATTAPRTPPDRKVPLTDIYHPTRLFCMPRVKSLSR